MQCRKCGKPFHPTRWWQEFCSRKCRADYHNRENSSYAAQVAEHELRMNGVVKSVALPEEPPLAPPLALLPVAVKPKNEEAA